MINNCCKRIWRWSFRHIRTFFWSNEYSPLNGVAHTGKCVGTEVLSKTCKGSQYWRGKEEQIGNLTSLNSHECAINFDGTAGSMENDGVISILVYSLVYSIQNVYWGQ